VPALVWVHEVASSNLVAPIQKYRQARSLSRVSDAGQDRRKDGGGQPVPCGAQWIDAEVQRRADARRVQVNFNSNEYFGLLSKPPDAAQWLSVGTNVQLLLGNTVCEIVQ
jgi:hypothetical protein